MPVLPMLPPSFAQACHHDGAHADIFPFDEVGSRVDAFVESVADVCKPACCPWCFGVLAYQLALSSSAVDAFQKLKHGFWTTCLRLLVAYSEQDVRPLRQQLASNQRACKDRARLHKQRYQTRGSDPFEVLINALHSVVAAGLTSGDNPLYNGPTGKNNFFLKRHGCWPVDLDQLFPSGVERGLDALIHWCCVPFSSVPFATINIFLMVARSVIMPKLCESPRRDRMAWAIMRCLSADGLAPWTGPPPFSMPPGLCVSRAVRRDPVMADSAVLILYVVQLGPHARTEDVTRFLADYEALFLAALERVAPSLDETRITPVRQLLCVLRGQLDRPHDACGDVCVRRNQRPHEAAILFEFLVRGAISGSCANRGCEETELDETDGMRRFQTCGRCKFARYCSRECQANDWKLGSPRHKDVCPSLCVILRRTQQVPAHSAAELQSALDECGIDPQDLALLVECASASDLIPQSFLNNPPADATAE